MLDLFSEEAPWQEPLADGATILRRRARDDAPALIEALLAVAQQNPFHHRITPGGHRMSVAMTNCGDFGWSSDSRGYQYTEQDAENGRKWPPMPPLFRQLALDCAREAGFPQFAPDACLINRYEPGAKLTLHQDKDERDLRQPIVSVSLGLPAVFQSAASRAATLPSACCWSMATWWYGVDRRACAITAFCRLSPAIIRWLARSATI